MTDQEKVPRFSNGEPALPLTATPSRFTTVMMVGLVLLGTLAALFLTLYMLFAALAASSGNAHAVEAPEAPAEVLVFEQPGDCVITTELRVRGTQRKACVEKLETAARLARAEMRVNERGRTR